MDFKNQDWKEETNCCRIAFPNKSELSAAYKRPAMPKKHWKEYDVEIFHRNFGKLKYELVQKSK
jgi:hypothetical protein